MDLAKLKDDILKGRRRALAKGITLTESSRPDHRAAAQELLAELLPHTGKSVRLGFTGTPGVGKSTFIEAFGTFLTGQGHRVAVLAIDPSSARNGGSILGDKTRMEMLSRDANAFIRPSPSGGTLGGVARRTREAMLMVEAAGYDVVLIETVGVGQSEVAVADMVDMFLLLLSPGGGDELQGIKRGIMELADLVIVNKADGDLEAAAKRAAADYRAALHLMRPKSANWTARVMLASALKNKGLEEIWEAIEAYRAALGQSGELAALRAEQAVSWMWSEIHDQLMDRFRDHLPEQVHRMEQQVRDGATPPGMAAQELLQAFLSGQGTPGGSGQ
ncbi:methylmalonyl Co-A mutase-associated GTPase MeaB [Luteithermobacter gelatinilyticus]|uniref:methylmalonyl Co-A mutase-associated GTPase MeaB n=1 Tax=Luteithermobacter gelatinilyticus TaxID=2582913 RepID=UPI00110759F9|nr:methylmalonyl Co-A mutase-associated GTPase MeaB [Luteithermobacter gelatinilyticus]